MLGKMLIALIALLHIYFMVLEMFFWTKPLGLKAFGQKREQAEASKVLAANQGLYNGFLAAGLIWSLLYPHEIIRQHLGYFFLACVLIAGLYGAATASRKILWVQALPAALAIIALVLDL